jgi:CcmD family protein
MSKMENVEFLAAAFAVFWGLTFFYVFSIARRQRNLERDVEVLESLLDEEQRET